MAEAIESLTVTNNAHGATGLKGFRIGSLVGARALTATTASVMIEDGRELVVGSSAATVASTFGLVDVGGPSALPAAVLSIEADLNANDRAGGNQVPVVYIALRGGHRLTVQSTLAAVEAALEA